MTEEELQSVLIPGAKLEAFVIDEKKLKESIKKCHERQEAILKQKQVDINDLRNTIINI